jgi:hypothetical protein
MFFGGARTQRHRAGPINAAPVVPPPPAGSLPIGDGLVTAEEAPYRVIFTDLDSNYIGIEGCLLNDLQTVLVSADAAEYIGGNLSKIEAVMGVADLGDFSTAQFASCSFTVYNPLWSGSGAYPNNIGYVFLTSGFIATGSVQPIEYSAAPDTTPFGGEYFYPPSTIAAWSSNLDQAGAIPSIITLQEGTKGEVISTAALDALLYGTNDTNIGLVIGGTNQGAWGTPLVVAGYATNYFCAGVWLFNSDLDMVAVFTRVSNASGWIESDTGISPIVYPP